MGGIINHKPMDLEKIHSQMLYLGLALNLGIPLGLLAIGFLLRKNGVGANPTPNLKLFFWVLFFVSVSELLAIFFLKKVFLPSSPKGV